MIAHTSVACFNEIRKDLGKKQFMVLLALSATGRASNRDLSKKYGLPINEVTPRIHELRSMGIVQHVDDQRDAESGKMAMVWEVLQPDEAKKNFREYLRKKAQASEKKEEFQKQFKFNGGSL